MTRTDKPRPRVGRQVPWEPGIGSHPLSRRKGGSGDEEFYTPVNEDLQMLMYRLRDEYGTWRNVATKASVNTRMVRRCHSGERPSVTLTTLERIFTGCGHPEFVDMLPWYRPADLIEGGVWRAPVSLVGGLSVRSATWDKRQRLARRKAKRRAAQEMDDEMAPVNPWVKG